MPGYLREGMPEWTLQKGIIAVVLAMLLLITAGCTAAGPGQPAIPTPTEPSGGVTPTETLTESVTPTETIPATETTGAEAVAEVLIRNFAFAPATLTVPVGTTVIWTNEDSAAHQVVSDTQPADMFLSDLASEALPQGEAYRFTFTKPGTFGYHCQIHPSMKGTIVVEE